MAPHLHGMRSPAFGPDCFMPSNMPRLRTPFHRRQGEQFQNTQLPEKALHRRVVQTIAPPAHRGPAAVPCPVHDFGCQARARAPESQVGPTVLSECDGALRATLAEAIRTGEAGICTVDSCIGLARGRAAEEATEAYRQRVRP